jgi:uncharacterized protein (DUF433 family)
LLLALTRLTSRQLWRDIPRMNERIEINPRVCGGQPVIKGTRIPVEVILGQLAEGDSWESLLKGYPELTRADIQAALRFARANVLHTELTELAPA